MLRDGDFGRHPKSPTRCSMAPPRRISSGGVAVGSACPSPRWRMMRIGWAWWTGRHLPPPRASPAEDFWEAFFCFGLSFYPTQIRQFFSAARAKARSARRRSAAPKQGGHTGPRDRNTRVHKNCPPTHY
eukprot:scaffold87372_cov26-Phaeocystis_antarctica.AAC.2